MNSFPRRALLLAVLALPLVALSAEPGSPGGGYYQETYRPQFHFTAEKGWLNDPNGLVYSDGEYHLFYQYNPGGTHWIAELSWGHAVSKDLVHWRHLPPALPPTPRKGGHPAGSWSGSGFVDFNNSAGFQTGAEKPIVLAWTAAGIGQCLAYSNDRGRTFTRYAGNPVVPMDPPKQGDWDRDPRVFWHPPTRRWVMVISVSGQGMKFYSSPDLKTWTSRSTFPGLFECPDMFELPVDGKAQDRKWVLHDASGKYFIGAFDGSTFTPESGPFVLDHGKNYYAAQSWSGVLPSDGRRISIAWMKYERFPGMPFNQQMTVPCVLALKTLPEGVRLTREPVRELEVLRSDGKTWKDQVIRPGADLLPGIEGDTFDIEAEIERGSAREVGIRVRGEQVHYDGHRLSCGGRSAPLPAEAGRVRLRVLVDRASVEVFGNGGAVSLTTAYLPPPEDRSLAIYAVGGEARVVSLHVYRMRSAWEKHTDTTPPSVPGRVRAAADGPSSATLRWEASTDPGGGIRSYLIYRDGSKVGMVEPLESPRTEFRDEGLREQTEYRYQVSAVNGWGLESAKSPEVSVKTPAGHGP